MKKMKRLACLLTSFALLAALLTGCEKEREETAEPLELRVNVCGALDTLDPAMVSGAGEESLLSTLFEGLMRMRDDGSGKAVAVTGMAKEYIAEQNYDDTVTYTFTLRSTARWSDGKRVKAEDFVYAWQRLADPATASPNAELLKMVAGYDEVRKTGDVSALGVSAKGDDTFIVTLSAPSAYFLTSVCASPATAPLRRDLVEASPIWAMSTETVTNGPYCVDSWSREDNLRVRRSEEYYETKLVGPDALYFTFDTDVQSNYEKLLSGALDYVSALPDAAVEALAQEESWQSLPLAETSCVLYNHLTDLFSDAQIRKAFDLAIDRASLAAEVGATATAAAGCVPYGVSGSSEGEDFRSAGGVLCAVDSEGYAERCAEASRLLTASGHYQGAGISTLRLVFPEDARMRAVAQELRSMWKLELGVEVEIEGLTQEELDERLAQGSYELLLTSITAHCDDALEFLLPFRGGAERNVCGHQNDTFDLLIGVAETTGDLNARAAFLHDAEAMLLEDSAVSPLYFHGTASLLREGYQGVAQDCFGHSYFTSVVRAESVA